MRTVLVSGAGGFIGRRCVAALRQRGFTVHGLSTTRSGIDPEGVVWHRADLLKQSIRSTLRDVRPSHVLHLAWCTEHGRFWTMPENRLWLEASRRLLTDFRETGGRRFVFAGSCAEYSWSYGDGCCVEGVTPEEPATLYGQCKGAFTASLAERVLRESVSTATGRVFFLYGPRETASRLVPAVIGSLLGGKAVRCSDGRQVRDFMYVDDVAEGLVALLDSRVEGVVNIASGDPMSVRTLVERIADRVASRDLVDFGALPRPAGDPDVLTAATKRLSDEVGFQPKINLDQGLALTIEWVRSTQGAVDIEQLG